MPRYIDADKIEWRLIIPTNATTAEENMIYHARKLVEFQPTADVVEVVHGKWIDGQCTNCECSLRETWFDEPISYANINYCPYCGAKMDERGKKDDEI